MLTRFCNEKVSCPQPIFWSSWSTWSKCSSECGGGVHSRSRNCENGNSCPGCALVRTPEVHTHLHTRFSLEASCSTVITKQLPERYVWCTVKVELICDSGETEWTRQIEYAAHCFILKMYAVLRLSLTLSWSSTRPANGLVVIYIHHLQIEKEITHAHEEIDLK